MLWLTDYEVSGVIMNIVAIIITAGVMINTSLYRKRKRLDDRLYYLMLIICMITAVTDAAAYFLLNSPFSSIKVLYILSNILYSFFIFILPYLFILYENYQCFKDTKRLKKTALLFGIPTLLGIVAYTMEDWLPLDTGSLPDIILVIVLELILFLYTVYLLYLFGRFNRKMLVVFLASIIGLGIITSVSAACVFAILLCFAHICAMNEPFYGEEGTQC